ncbi:MAG: hypothetical protein WBA25_04455, partial [Jannaschia sp.]
MTPRIALDLSLDGIAVLSRAPDGKWWREGTVRLDAEDMPDGLARLRNRAAARVGPDFTSVLILPDSQLLYTSLERDDRRPEETIRTLLKGRTPYAVEDLTFDYNVRGDRLQVAVVALETLLEAETFAAEYGFRPVAVCANPKGPAYAGIPTFGQTGIAADLLGGEPLELGLEDGFNIVPAPAPPKLVVPDPEPEGASDDGIAPATTEAPDATPAADIPPTFATPRAESSGSRGFEAPATAPVLPPPGPDGQPGFATS